MKLIRGKFMYKKILALLMLVMFVCCGCGNRKDEPIENDLNTITSRDTVLVGVKTDTYPVSYTHLRAHET